MGNAFFPCMSSPPVTLDAGTRHRFILKREVPMSQTSLLPDPVTDHLLTLLRRDLTAFEGEVLALTSDADLWRCLPGISNSVGNLALHVAGNLRHFVGGVLAGDGYVRDRDAEFARRAGSRAEILDELRKARTVVEATLPGLTESQLTEPFPLAIEGQRFPTRVFLLRLAVHLAYHLGQANHLRRILNA